MNPVFTEVNVPNMLPAGRESEFLCPFLVSSDKKRTKRNTAKEGKVLQNSAAGIAD